MFDPDFLRDVDHQVGGRHRRRARRSSRSRTSAPRSTVGARPALPRADVATSSAHDAPDPVHREAQPEAAATSAASTRCTRTTPTGSTSRRTRRDVATVDAVPRRRDASTTAACASCPAATPPGCGRRAPTATRSSANEIDACAYARRRVGAARVPAGSVVMFGSFLVHHSAAEPRRTATAARSCSATSRPAAPHMLESLPSRLASRRTGRERHRGCRRPRSRDVARAGRRVAGHRVARRSNGTGPVSPGAGRSGSGTRPRPARLPARRAGAGAAPAAQPGVGGDRRRHREPVLHRGGPRHRGRRPRRGPPPRALQLRRGRRRPKRRTSTSSSPSGWPASSIAVASPAESSSAAPARPRDPGGRRRPPAASTHDVDSVVVDNRLGGETATAHLLAHGRDAHRLHHRTGRVDTANERLRRATATPSPRAGLPVDRALVRRADFKEDGGYRAARSLLEPTRRPTRCSSPTTR